MSIAIGPDVWGNAPDGSSPVDEIQPWLTRMRDAADGWRDGIEAKGEYWNGKIDSLETQISGLSAAISDDVFLTKLDRASYDVVNGAYQDLKDKLTLSPDFFLTQTQQDLNNDVTLLGKASGLFDGIWSQTGALLRQLFGSAGLVIGGAIVIVLAYLYLTRRK